MSKVTVYKFGHVQDHIANELRKPMTGVPTSAKGPTRSKGANGAPSTSADKRRSDAELAKRRASNDPRKQYQPPFNQANRKKPFDAGGL